MKIKINEIETYEINFDVNKEINLNELDFYLERLNRIRKTFAKEMPIGKIKKEINKIPRGKLIKNPSFSIVSLTREVAVKILNVYYSDNSVSAKRTLMKEIGDYEYNRVQLSIFAIRKKFNIKAEEVGLRHFPMKAFEKREYINQNGSGN